MTHLKLNRPDVKTWNGLLNELFADFDQNAAPLTGGSTLHNNPPVNVVETEDGYHLELLAPGRNKELFALEVVENQLKISYNLTNQANNTGNKQIRKEFTIGNFKRVFNVTDKIETEAIQAKYEDGLLKVFLPKKAEVKPVTKSINIQ